MSSKKLIASSILTADFSNLSQQIRFTELGGADWIHCDIMDGKFVPNLTFGPVVVQAVRKITKEIKKLGENSALVKDGIIVAANLSGDNIRTLISSKVEFLSFHTLNTLTKKRN